MPEGFKQYEKREDKVEEAINQSDHSLEEYCPGSRNGTRVCPPKSETQQKLTAIQKSSAQVNPNAVDNS